MWELFEGLSKLTWFLATFVPCILYLVSTHQWAVQSDDTAMVWLLLIDGV